MDVYVNLYKLMNTFKCVLYVRSYLNVVIKMHFCWQRYVSIYRCEEEDALKKVYKSSIFLNVDVRMSRYN